MSKTPFACFKYKTGMTNQKFCTTYFFVGDQSVCVLQVKATAGTGYEFFWYDTSGVVHQTQEWTIPENCIARVGPETGPSSYVYAELNANYVEKISCDFGMNVQKKDLGEIGGYGDDLIFKNTTNLSGTYADGTDFSYTVPVVVEG